MDALLEIEIFEHQGEWFWQCTWADVGLGPPDEPSGPYHSAIEAVDALNLWINSPEAME